MKDRHLIVLALATLTGLQDQSYESRVVCLVMNVSSKCIPSDFLGSKWKYISLSSFPDPDGIKFY